MNRTIALWIILFSISLCSAVSKPAAQQVPSGARITSRLQAKMEGPDGHRCRLSAVCGLEGGELAVFIDEGGAPGDFGFRGFGLAAPSCDLGPLKEMGLLRALNHPAGIGSATERSVASLDRSFTPGSLTGGVVRFHGPSVSRRVVELYGVARGGLAPKGTSTGGVLLATGLAAGLSLEIGSKITLFGRRDEEAAWFLSDPEANPPTMFRTGARLIYRSRRATAALTAGGAFSDSLRPSSFGMGSVRFSGDLPEGESGERPVYSVGLDAVAVAPDYIGDDGRYTTQTLVVRPAASLRLSRMSLSAWYRCELYPLPTLPAAYRRIVHSASVAGQVRFGALLVGAAVRPRLDFADDGRTLYRVLCAPRVRLAAGCLTLDTELQLTHSNFEAPKIGAGLAVRGEWGHGTADIGIDVDEGRGGLEAHFALAGGRWLLTASLTVPEVLRVDFGAPRITGAFSTLRPLERASSSLSFQIGVG